MLILLCKIFYWSNKNEIVRTIWEQIRKLSLNSREGIRETTGTHKAIYNYVVSIHGHNKKKGPENNCLAFVHFIL